MTKDCDIISLPLPRALDFCHPCLTLGYRIVQVLIALLSRRGCETIHLLTTDNMILDGDKSTLHVADKMEQTCVETHVQPLEFLSTH